MKKILVVSDIHDYFLNIDKVLESKKFDIKIFLGDLESKSKKDYLKNFDYSVKGNHDYFMKELPYSKVITVEGLNIFITHGQIFDKVFFDRANKDKILKFLKKNVEEKIDIVLYGHTHSVDFTDYKDVRFLNPGSISFPRSDAKPSYLILSLDNKKIVEEDFIYIKEKK